MKKTLYGSESDNCCGFCRRHHCALTVKQLKKKECLKKQCRHLVQYEEHPYWAERAKIREIKNQRKEERKNYNKEEANVS